MRDHANRRIAAVLIAALALLSCFPATTADGPTPFTDAVAVWHVGGLEDSAAQSSEPMPCGNARAGVELTGAERAASLARGGDGRVARLNGGYLEARQGVDDKLNLEGNAVTLCARLRDPGGNWMAPLFSKHGGHDKLVYNHKDSATVKTLAVWLTIARPFAASAEVQVQAHYNLKGAGGIRDTACPETLKDQAGKSPDLKRQGSPKVMSNAPEARWQEHDSSIKFEGPDQCYSVAKNLVGGDNFVVEAWAYALNAAR